MRKVTGDNDFDAWRETARRLLMEAVPPEQIRWSLPGDADLFAPPPLAGGGGGRGPVLTNVARKLRREMTVPEQKLWALLRNQPERLKFRRQEQIGAYIVDFFCASARLVVEVDGRTHDEFSSERDAVRQAWLEAQGLQVIRFMNDDVLAHAESVAAEVLRVAGEERPLPLPPPAGGGGTLHSFLEPQAPSTVVEASFRVPAAFVDLAKTVLCHRDAVKFPLLYRTLWRITHGQHDLLKNAVDDDVRALQTMEKAVRRDCHKMTAFVRFKKIQTDDGGEQYVAWHRPDHLIVRRMAGFFVDRFRSMSWAILTPDASVAWENHELKFGPGVPNDPLLGDVVEDLWTTYYANVFNPARIKLKAMQKEMPKKHWPTLPETKLIPQMLADAPARVRKMLDAAPKVPLMLDYVPKTSSLRVLHEAAEKCRACDIGCHATQVVFGEGPKTARVMFVGEQPGDQEDLAGRPFVGPSGHLLNEVCDEVGLDRGEIYVTNAVKHFKFEPRGKRRIHAKPNAREMAACKPWLLAELDIVKPDILVMLGATAAQQLVGRQFRITQSRGQWFESEWSKQSIATFHPSAILRSYDEETMQRNKAFFTEDLRKVAQALKKAG